MMVKCYKVEGKPFEVAVFFPAGFDPRILPDTWPGREEESRPPFQTGPASVNRNWKENGEKMKK